MQKCATKKNTKMNKDTKGRNKKLKSEKDYTKTSQYTPIYQSSIYIYIDLL